MNEMVALWIVDELDNSCQVPLVINKSDIGSHKVNKWLKLNLPHLMGFNGDDEDIKDAILDAVSKLSSSDAVVEWNVYGETEATIFWKGVEVL